MQVQTFCLRAIRQNCLKKSIHIIPKVNYKSHDMMLIVSDISVAQYSLLSQGGFFSAYRRISADFPRILDPPEISTNLGRK